MGDENDYNLKQSWYQLANLGEELSTLCNRQGPNNTCSMLI